METQVMNTKINLAAKLVVIGMFSSLSVAIAYVNTLTNDLEKTLQKVVESESIKRGVFVAATTRGSGSKKTT